MSVFEDSFGATPATALADAGYVPTLLGGGPGTGTYAAVAGATSPVVTAGHRAGVQATGENTVVASGVPSTTEYDVECDLCVVAVDTHDADSYGIYSHSADDGSARYSLVFATASGAVQPALRKTGTQVAGSAFFTPTVGETYHLKIQVRENGSNPAHLDVSAFVSRASDGFYWHNPTGSFVWDATAAPMATWTDDGTVGGAVLGTGKGGIKLYGYAGYYEVDNFVVTNFSTAALSVSPAAVAAGSTGDTLTLTGTGTSWTAGTPGTPTFAASAGTVTGQSVASGTSATLTYDAPATAGTVTLTDPSTGQTATVSVYTPASQLAFSGPASGSVGAASANFTVTPNSTYTGTVTPSDGGAGGAFTPGSLSWSLEAGAKTFTYTAASAGTKTVTLAGAGVAVSPASLSYLAVAKGNLVFAGDSRTYGVDASAGAGTVAGTCYPGVVMTCLGSAGWDGHNLGVSGWEVADLVTDKPAHVDPLYNASASINLISVMIGTNDLGGGATAAGTWAAIQGYCQSLQTSGWKVILNTLPSCDYSGTVIDTQVADLNALIRAGYATCADALADSGGDSHLAPPGAYSNTTYFAADGIHNVDPGYALVAAYCLGATANFAKVSGGGGGTALILKSGQRRRSR